MPVSEDKSLSYTTTASLPLFTSGRIGSSIDAAGASLSASQHEETKTVSDIKLNVAEAYVASLRAGRGIEVAESAVSSLTAHASDVGHFFEQGVVAKNDLLAAQVALSDARQQAIRSRNALDIAHASYNRLLHRPLDQAVMIDDVGCRDIEAGYQRFNVKRVTKTSRACRPVCTGESPALAGREHPLLDKPATYAHGQLQLSAEQISAL